MTFGVNQLYTLDLRDDFIMNYDDELYEFIDGDPVKAYQLGTYVTKWFDELSRDQQYLHAKHLRHINEETLPYSEQIQYWAKKFSVDDNEEVDLLEMCDYIYNNIIWLENEEEDKIKVALFLGMITGKQMTNRDQDVDEMSVKNYSATTSVIINSIEEDGEHGDDSEEKSDEV